MTAIPKRTGLSGLARHRQRRKVVLEQGRHGLETQGQQGLFDPARSRSHQLAHRHAQTDGRSAQLRPDQERQTALRSRQSSISSSGQISGQLT
ncbi:MAG: hypothetical protein ABJN90_00300 [Hyphomicrobiales bacterium]